MKMAPTPTKWVPVAGGVKLATFEYGQGRPIVLINGLGASAHDWGPTVEQLSQRTRVITFDNRGAGQSTVPDEPFSLEQMADDTAAVFEAYGLVSAPLVGYSMGGMIAQLLAVRRPALVERLVLMATHPGAASAVPSTDEARTAMFSQEKIPREELVRRQYAVYVAPNFLAHHRDVFERMMTVRIANLIPRYAWQRQVEAILGSERSDVLKTLRVPTLIVHGRNDSLIPYANGERIHQLIPGSRLVTIEDCGHMVNWEKPEQVVNAISDFLGL